MRHLAIIADGNRRWAKMNGLPTQAGYMQGLVAIERCCDWAIKNNLEYLTVYCFSTENWQRPANEVNALMDLAKWYFDTSIQWYVNMDIRVQFKGRRDRFDDDFLSKMYNIEAATKHCKSMVLVICVDYGGRDEIVRAVQSGAKTEEEIISFVSNNVPDPDMIVRTGGCKRLSNFLLWQSAYAELLFEDILFPAITTDTLNNILLEYKTRQRNYGK